MDRFGPARPNFIDLLLTILACAAYESNFDEDVAFKIMRKLFKTPYICLYESLYTMIDEHGSLTSLISHLNNKNGSSYRKRKKYVTQYLARKKTQTGNFINLICFISFFHKCGFLSFVV